MTEMSDVPNLPEAFAYPCGGIPGLAALPRTVYEAACRRVISATERIAVIKNVPTRLIDSATNANNVVGLLHFNGRCEGMLREDPEAVGDMHYYIDNYLDGLAIREAAMVTARDQGLTETTLDWETLTLWTDEVFIRLRERIPAGGFYRWRDLESGLLAFAEFGIFPSQGQFVKPMVGLI